MRTLYLDCGMGASGDMLMAALSEAAPGGDGIAERIEAMGLPGVRAGLSEVTRCGIRGRHIEISVHGESEDAHEHHHHHDHDHEEHDEHCTCGCHDHDHDHDEHDHEHHHHHHHADEVFTSWGTETTRKFTKDEIEHILEELDNSEKYGMILRAKGIVAGRDGEWIHFDYVPEETSVRNGSAGVIGRLCVIGSHINEAAIEALFA